MIKLLVACREEQQAIALRNELVRADSSIAAEATDIAAARVKASFSRPDVLLLEHREDEAHNAWYVISRILQVSGNTRVLLLCDRYSHRSIIGFMQWGASGCVALSHGPYVYAMAARTVHAGETWFGRSELPQALRSQLHVEDAASLGVIADWLAAPPSGIVAG